MRTAANRGSLRTVQELVTNSSIAHYLQNETVVSTNFDASISIACSESDATKGRKQSANKHDASQKGNCALRNRFTD